MLQKHLYMSDIFNTFVLDNQTYTNGIVATYHTHET